MNVAEVLISMVAPPSCVGCGQEGSCLCMKCASDIEPLPLGCYKCGTLSPSGICPSCKRTTRLSGVYVACLYNGSAAKLVRELKYKQNRSAAESMSMVMNKRLPIFGDCTITSMPTAQVRIRQRGFDHAQLLAKRLAGLRGLHYHDLLGRVGSERQVGSSKSDRLNKIKGQIWMKSIRLAKDKHVIIVDDVITTGGSVDEAARVLKLAGAKKVIAISFAQKKIQ